MAFYPNTFSATRESNAVLGLENWRSGLLVAAVTAIACALGWTIALENWLLFGVAVTLLLVLVWPLEVTLGLYAFLIPFESITTTGSGSGPSATLLRYVGLATLVVVPCVGWLRGRMVKPPRAALYWSLFILCCAVSAIWAIDQKEAFDRLPMAVGLWLLYLAIVSVRISCKELSRLTLLSVLGGVGASIAATHMFFTSGGGALGRASIGNGLVREDPNFFAATLLLPLALGFGEVFASGTWWRRSLFMAGVGVITLSIYLSMSRGVLIAAATIIFVFIVRLRMNWRLVFPVVVLGAALLFVPSLFYERVQEASDSRVSGRLDIWEAGLHSLTRYGLFGAGLDNFPDAYQQYSGTARFFSGEKRASHNIYLSTSVELGILGILALIAAVRSHLREFGRPASTLLTHARVIAFEAACWGMLVAGLSLDLLWRKAFWLVWALPVIAIHVRRESEEFIGADKYE